jgi:hypothetical protein
LKSRHQQRINCMIVLQLYYYPSIV